MISTHNDGMYSLFAPNMTLDGVSTMFSSTAVECVNALLGVNSIIKDPWLFVPRLEAEYENIIIMGSASNQYQAILAVGIDDNAINHFIGKNDIDRTETFDIFGEIANNYCAMIMDHKEFLEQFGTLNQSIPVLYSKGIPFLPFISGIEGKIYSNNQPAYFGFAIQKKRSATVNP
ncbi:MAG: hypothetical protein GX639_00950 [Fibrobacter sp.]|nr:hypothetical protein [Fibrobacter sp.]